MYVEKELSYSKPLSERGMPFYSIHSQSNTNDNKLDYKIKLNLDIHLEY